MVTVLWMGLGTRTWVGEALQPVSLPCSTCTEHSKVHCQWEEGELSTQAWRRGLRSLEGRGQGGPGWGLESLGAGPPWHSVFLVIPSGSVCACTPGDGPLCPPC